MGRLLGDYFSDDGGVDENREGMDEEKSADMRCI